MGKVNTAIRIRVTRGRRDFWYSKYIGYETYVTHVKSDVYWVREPDGYLNFIFHSDCEIISDNTGEIIKINTCSNPILWYDAEIGKSYEIVWENEKAYWVKHPSQFNAWVYKHDVGVINEV